MSLCYTAGLGNGRYLGRQLDATTRALCGSPRQQGTRRQNLGFTEHQRAATTACGQEADLSQGRVLLALKLTFSF